MTNLIKQSVIELHDAFSKNRFDDVLQLCSDDIVANAHAMGLSFKGKEGFAGFMQAFKGAFPDMVITHKNFMVQDNKVAVEFAAKGTHTGELKTPAGVIPPSRKTVELNVAEFMIWENGKLKHLDNYQDSSSLLRQIGVLN